MIKLKFLYSLFFVLVYSAIFSQAPADKHYNIWLDKTKHDTVRVQNLKLVAQRLMNLNPDSAESLAKQGLQFLKKINRKNEEADFYNSIGGSAFYKGNSAKAIEYYEKAIEANKKLDRMESVGAIYTNIASAYYINKDYHTSIEFFKKGLSYIDTADKTNLPTLSLIYMNMAGMFSTVKDTNHAISYFNKSLRITTQLKDSINMTQAWVQMANFYMSLKKLDSVKVLLDRAQSYVIRKNDPFSLIFYKLYGANYFLKIKDYKTAIQNFHEAEKLAFQIDYGDVKKDANYGLYQTFTILNKSDSALKYHLRYIQWRDTLTNKEMTENILRRSMNDEYKTQKRIDDKENQMQIHKIEEKEKQQKIIAFSAILILLLVAVFAFIIYKRLKLTRKQKTEIQEQKRLIEDKQKEILDSIRYAQRIQKSMLPSEKYMDRNLKK